MLSWGFIVERVREELSLPFQMLEKSDEQIIDYLKRNALRKFTFYYPQKWRLTLDCADNTFKVPGRSSEFYLIDPDEREIKTVIDVIPTLSPTIMNGHPFLGPWSASEVPEWHLSVFNSNLLAPFSNYKYCHEFIPPNCLRITPKFHGKATVEYERSHDPELSSINPEMEDNFIDLCLGMFFMMLGRLRSKYSTTQTPFGEIPLNGDMLYQDGKEIYDRTIEKFERSAIPNVVFDHG